MNPNLTNFIAPKGIITIEVENENGYKYELTCNNTVLDAGRAALAQSLANDFGDSYQFYIKAMRFGNGGTAGGVPITVTSARTGIFGTAVAEKSIISLVNPTLASQAVFTTVLKFDEANDTINELALVMANDSLYSLATFEGISKTSSMQITFNWRLSFV
tara:strand:+ start:3031 stop:3510 length:480 start_codon:yes stop_codon:yes gene_type:complete